MGNAYRSVLALKPTGDAVPANVLAGKTFSNADGTGKTGTMANNGAVSVTLTDQDPTYTIPEGYHNGSGVVGFTASGGDGADLIVTCSDNFAGATISCTDGTTTYQQICPSTAPFEVVFESIPVGTWTISGTAEGELFSTQFTVVDFETALNSTPEGSTAVPTDDIQIWLHCANIWDKSYTTISEILSDSSTLQSLIASNNAADYMARSSTWASDVTANSSAMTYIGLNDYCSNSLLDDSTWLNAICNSSYFESILNVKVPVMTSDTTPSGEVIYSAQSSNNNYHAFKAFDGIDSTLWTSGLNDLPEWIGYIFTSAINVRKVATSFVSPNVSATFDIEASNDGSAYTSLYSGLTAAGSTTVNTVLSNSSKFNRFRVKITAQDRGQNTVGQISTLQFYGRA